MRWALRNVDAFRMLSFQVVAPVGRTRTEPGGDLTERLFEGVDRAIGRVARRKTFLIGHPECHDQALFWVVRIGDAIEVVEVCREGARIDDLFMDELTRGAFRTLDIDDATRAEAVARVAGLLLRSPRYLLTWPLYALYRIFDGHVALAARLLSALFRGEPCSISPFVLVVHRFMSPAELETPLGRERLAACTFRVPAGGRMVPMCEMNATPLRESLNRDAQKRLVRLDAHRSAR